jgi:phosphatidylglycerol lysyltransferase
MDVELLKKNDQRQSIKRWVLPLLSVIIFGVVLYVAHRLLNEYRWRDVLVHMRAIQWQKIGYAASLTAASYLVLTGFDTLGLRYAGRHVLYRRTALVSFMAYAFGHNVGVAAFSGAALRYRLYSTMGLGVVDVATVVGFCSLTTLLGISTVGGVGLLLEPNVVATASNLHQDLIQGIGISVLACAILYLLWALFARGQLTIRDWSLKPPGARIALPQLALSMIDMVVASGALWMLLPDASRPSLLAFSGAYTAAVLAGLVSTVPAGLGVFESVILLLLPDIPGDQLLGCLLVYRVVYYLAPLALATVLFVVIELGRQRTALGRMNALASMYVKPIAPQLAGVLIFVSGAVLLVSGATPAIDARLRELHRMVPLPILELSHLIGSVVGIGLLIIARGLFRRLRVAYHVTFWLLVVGAIASLLKGFDFEEASVLAIVLLVLYWGRAAFYRPATLGTLRFSPPWIVSIVIVLAVTTWLAFFAHRHVEYSTDLWWTFATHADAPRVLRALLITGVIASALIVANWFAPADSAEIIMTGADMQKVASILPISSDSLANVVLSGDKRVLFHEQGDAFIMYQVVNRSWIALGDPVGVPERQEELVWQFRELCDRHGGRIVFYTVTPEHLPLYIDLGLSLVKLGEEARVPLSDFSVDGSARADLRQAKRRAERDGASFGIIPIEHVREMLPQLRAVSDAWLQDKATGEKGFSLGAFDEEYLARFPIAVVRAEGAIVAFANVWVSGDREELSVDLMRFVPDAPRSAMDYLFIELMLWGRQQGYRWFNLGMAPLSGLETHALAPAWHRVGNFVFKYAEQFYNFDGLRRYKTKFQPQWRPRYLAFPGGLALPRVLLDVSTLISGGVRELVSK